MDPRSWLALLAAVSLLGLAACGDSDDDQSASGADQEKTSVQESDDSSADGSETEDEVIGEKEAAAIARGDTAQALLYGDRLAEDVRVDEGSDEDRIADVVDVLYDSFADGKPKRFCAQFSEAAHRSMAKEIGGNTGPDVACLQTFDPLVLRAGKVDKLNATQNARIVGIQVDGDTATVNIDFDGEPGDLSLVKQDGKWKLDAVPPTPKQ